MSVKQLSAGHLRNLADYDFSRYFVHLPPDYEYEDIFRPVFWAHFPRLKKYDVIRVIAHDWSWDVTVTVLAKTPGGANVQLTPVIPERPGQMAVEYVPRKADGRLAIRVEYRKATNWRVIALDGSEHSNGYETEAAAQKAMAEYVHALGLKMPPDEPKKSRRSARKDEHEMTEQELLSSDDFENAA